MGAIEFMLGSLAVWRVTHFCTSEEGPFAVVVHVRRLAGRGFLGQLLDCFYCLSLWIAAPVALWMQTQWRDRILLWLALSAAAILINRVADAVAADRPLYFEAPDTPAEEES